MSKGRTAFALVSILVLSVFIAGIIPSTISVPLDVKDIEISDELSLEQKTVLSSLHSSNQSSVKTIDTTGINQLGWAEMNYLSNITEDTGNDIPFQIWDFSVDNNGNALIVGYFFGNITLGNFSISSTYSPAGNGYSAYYTTDVFVAKLNPQGVFLWVTTSYTTTSLYTNSGHVLWGQTIETDSNGNSYVVIEGFCFGCHSNYPPTVTFGNYSHNSNSIYVAKISADGYWMWVTSTSSAPSGNHKIGIALDSYNNVFIAGRLGNTGGVYFGDTEIGYTIDSPLFLAKISANGDWQWVRSGSEWAAGLGGTDNYGENAIYIEVGIDDSIYATGFYRSTETDDNGDSFTMFGNLTVYGDGISDSYYQWNGYVAKLNSTNGEWIWVTPFGGWGYADIGRDITIDENNNIFITYSHGRGTAFQSGNSSTWSGWQYWYTPASAPYGSSSGIAKIDSEGVFLWAKESIIGTQIEASSDGKIFLLGSCEAWPGCGQNHFIPQINDWGHPTGSYTISFDGANISFHSNQANNAIIEEINSENGSVLWGTVGMGINVANSKITVFDSTRVLMSSRFFGAGATSYNEQPIIGIHSPCENHLHSSCIGSLLVTLRPDLDGDGFANSIDSDDDGDDLSDLDEINLGLDPLHPDSDEDGVCDHDIGVSILGVEVCDAGPDPFPLDANEWLDTDQDGVGNNADLDDDGDGLSDLDELAAAPPTDPLLADTDADGVCDGPIQVDVERWGVFKRWNSNYEWINNISDLNSTAWVGVVHRTFPQLYLSSTTDNYLSSYTDHEILYDAFQTSSYLDYIIGDVNILSQLGAGYYLQFIFGPSCLEGPDAFPLDHSEWYDTDNDGIGNNADSDDDDDGWRDDKEEDYCNENNDPLDDTDMPTDTDGDWICNWQDWDDDGDEIRDSWDLSPLDPCIGFDTDGDGLSDRLGNTTLSGDECDSSAYEIDQDDDGDAWSDEDESVCDTDSLDNTSVPADLDADHICDIVDTDDDDDGVADESDIWPRDSCAAFDTDSDGIPDTVIDGCQTNLTADDDDDGDSVLDVDDFCSLGEIGWISGATLGTDHDGDGCRDDGEDTDDDNDGVNDSEDGCPRGITGAAFNSIFDTDGDGCLEVEDSDDDNDGVSDINDDFPLDPSETTDTDGDGIGDNADTDDDGDGLLDIEELLIGTDSLSEDSDSDGVRDSEDIFPLDSTEWADNDGDGTGDNSDAFPSIARYQTYGGIALELSGVLIIVIIAVLVLRMRGGGESEEDTPEPNNTDPMEYYVQQLIAQGYPEETARHHAQQYAEHFQK
ncbi:MAG: hypothetical protein CMA50_01685 [Euryarchaeota archaeon]|nr:hypothetical protein [Euryarchaeota archaeon]